MSALSIILGICSTMLSNCFYLSTSYIVKNHNVVAGEITVFSAILRIFVFGIWSAKVKCTKVFNKDQRSGNNEDSEYGATAWLSLIISNMAIAVTILLSYVAVTLMPLSDFIVFGFTSPVFTLLFVMACNRSKATLLNISMCLLIVVGTSLVAQPTFIFGAFEDQDDSPYKDTYTLGVVLALAASFITGFCPVLQTRCKHMPMAYFMLWSGISKLLIGLFCPVAGLPNHIQDPHKFEQDFWTLSMVAAASMLGLLFMQMAVTVSGAPLLVAVTRSMEIVMALVVDMITTADTIDFTDSYIWYKVTGAVLVMMCVVGIALSDLLEERMPSFCKRRTRDGYEIFNEEGDSETSALHNNQGLDYGTTEPRG